jgi:hypothetical protein
MEAHRILFIGNSYTHCNDMPGMITALAESTDRKVEWGMLAPGGWTLEQHHFNHHTKSKIEQGEWHTVVMQEQSTRPVQEPEAMIAAGKKLAVWIREAGASPVLYMTWSRTHLPETQNQLIASYRELGKAIDAAVAPAGIAWHKALAVDPELSLYVEDGSHPSFLGSYLSACVLCSTILGISPVGLTRSLPRESGVTAAIDCQAANVLQTAAWEAVQEEQ